MDMALKEDHMRKYGFAFEGKTILIGVNLKLKIHTYIRTFRGADFLRPSSFDMCEKSEHMSGYHPESLI
jgi:hypothetical protein